MAAHDQKKEQKQKARVGPGLDAGNTSRVSKAAGNLGSESMRVEQRARTPSTKQRSQNPSPARKSQGSKQGAKKGSSAKRLDLDPGLLLPIRALSVGYRVSGNLWIHIANRPFLAYFCSSCQFSCSVLLHFGIHYLYLAHLIASSSHYLDGEHICLFWA